MLVIASAFSRPSSASSTVTVKHNVIASKSENEGQQRDPEAADQAAGHVDQRSRPRASERAADSCECERVDSSRSLMSREQDVGKESLSSSSFEEEVQPSSTAQQPPLASQM